METNYSHIQMSKEKNSIIYVIPTNEVCKWFDEMIQKNVDVSNCFLLKTENK